MMTKKNSLYKNKLEITSKCTENLHKLIKVTHLLRFNLLLISIHVREMK
jgi:hypothetical protein